MLAPLLLAAVTTFHPAQATVGDPITIDFATPITLDASTDYEVVSRSGNRVVIRTFVPHTIAVAGRGADGPVSVMIPIHSVLKPDDKLEPAPLRPPRSEAWPRRPFIAVGVAAFAAVAAWTAVVLLARRRRFEPVVVIAPSKEFRSRVLALRPDSPTRWARLADAVRAYLSATRSELGAELTTAELLARVADAEEVERRRPAGWTAAGPAATADVAGAPAADPPNRTRVKNPPEILSLILHQGDLEKFSPWGAPPADFDNAIERALEIPEWAEPEPVQRPEGEVAA